MEPAVVVLALAAVAHGEDLALKPPKVQNKCNCESYDEESFENVTSVLTYRVDGRLGNQMLAYAMLLGAKRKYGFRIFLKERVIDNLDHFFDFSSTAPVRALETLCDEQYPWSEFAEATLDLTPVTKGHALEIESNISLLGRVVNTRFNWIHLLAPVEDEVRETFVFRERFRLEAEKRLAEVARTYREEHGKSNEKDPTNITFVGVHIRKGDCRETYVKKVGLPELAASYYVSAIEAYREKFRDVAFLLFSDEMGWVWRHLMPKVSGSAAVFPVSSPKAHTDEDTGNDLATLARCNHTVLSHGTYSFWAGFFSGGRRIIPSSVLYNSEYNPLDTAENLRLGAWNFTDFGILYV